MTELSGFEVLALVKEVGLALEGTYVNNIYSLGEAQILRFRRTGGQEVWIVASPSYGMWVSELVSERAETTEFTSRLRREVERLRAASSEQSDLDRVFILGLGEGESRRMLVLEMMPPGNIVLTDSNGRVLLAMRESRSGRRKVYRGAEYLAPPQSRLSPRSLSPSSVAEMARAEPTVGKALGKHVAIPRKYVEEALARLGLKGDEPSSRILGMEGDVVRVLGGLVADAEERPSPCLCRTPSGDEVFVVVPEGREVIETATSLSSLCDKVFLPKVLEETEAEPTSEDRESRELESTISKLRADADAMRKEAEQVRSKALAASRAASSEEAAAILEAAGLKGEPRSPASAASLLYDKAKALEAKASEAEGAAGRLSRRVPKRARTRPAGTRALARKNREWFEKFRWFYTTSGRLAIGGRDAQSNSMIVKRHLESRDTVYHADLFGSPFFVLKGGADQSESEVKEVAQATVAFSSAWKTGLGAADAYWVAPEQVAVAAPSGEYLARGSFVIRGKKNFVARNVVELALGLDGGGRLVSGPETAVRSACGRYVVIKPYRAKASDTAKRILADLSSMGGVPRTEVTVDEILRAMPAGGGRVARKAGDRSPDVPPSR